MASLSLRFSKVSWKIFEVSFATPSASFLTAFWLPKTVTSLVAFLRARWSALSSMATLSFTLSRSLSRPLRSTSTFA